MTALQSPSARSVYDEVFFSTPPSSFEPQISTGSVGLGQVEAEPTPFETPGQRSRARDAFMTADRLHRAQSPPPPPYPIDIVASRIDEGGACTTYAP